MDVERLVKISRGNVPVGRSPGRLKRRWSDLIIHGNRGNNTYKEEEEEEED